MFRAELPITTSRLTLRRYEPTDLEALYEVQSRADVTRYLYWAPRTRAEVADALRLRLREPVLDREGDLLILAVVLRETGTAPAGTVLGEVNLAWRSVEHRQGEFGFVFHPDHHGHGYAGEAAVEMLRLGFDGLGLHRIVGRCDGRNTASARLMGKLGLRREAHLVQNEQVKGEWTDEVIYALLAREWAARSRRG